MIGIPVTAFFDFHSLWATVASIASVVALWAESKAKRQPDPVDELMERVRHPVRFAFRHPVVSVRRKLDRRRV